MGLDRDCKLLAYGVEGGSLGMLEATYHGEPNGTHHGK